MGHGVFCQPGGEEGLFCCSLVWSPYSGLGRWVETRSSSKKDRGTRSGQLSSGGKAGSKLGPDFCTPQLAALFLWLGVGQRGYLTDQSQESPVDFRYAWRGYEMTDHLCICIWDNEVITCVDPV